MRSGVFRLESQGAKACETCRTRQELSNEYLLAKFDVDTADKGLLRVCKKKTTEVRNKVGKNIGVAAAAKQGPEALAACLKDDNENVRIAAVEAFQDLGERAAPAVAGLSGLLKAERSCGR